MGERDHRRDLCRQECRRTLTARRFHPDLLVDPPAPLQRTRARVRGPRHRCHRLRVGQRPVRHGSLGGGPGGGQCDAAARRQWGVHPRNGDAGRQERPQFRPALVALFDAGSRQEDREDVHRAAGAGRPIHGLRRRHDARLRQSRRKSARPRRDPDARRLRILRKGQAAAHRRRLRFRRDPAAAHDPQPRDRRDRRCNDGSPGVHQRT